MGPSELMIVGIIAVLLFGRRLPEVARSLGSSYREFRKGLNDLQSQVNLNEIYSSVPPSRKASTATKSSTYGDFDDHTEATAPKFEPPPCEPRPAETAPTPSDEITKPISER
jgi:sec-independent protein translocase protein TatA